MTSRSLLAVVGFAMATYALAEPPRFAPYVATPPTSGDALSVVDLDGDGRKDVVMTSPKLNLYFQRSDGTLEAAPQLDGGDGRSVATGDFNGDGQIDVATTSNAGIVWYAGTGNRNFALQPTLGMRDYRLLEAADVDGDGRTDLVAMQFIADRIDVFYQLPGGGFSAAIPLPATLGGWNDVRVVDINGDQRKDIVFSSHGNPDQMKVGFLVQRSDGTFDPVYYSAYSFGTLFIGGIDVTDVNGDGSPDVLVAAGKIIALFNQGANFDKGTEVTSAGAAETIRVGDVDGDGLHDAVVLKEGVGLGVFPRLPGGGFAAASSFALPYTTFYYPRSLAIGDLNGDGRPDLAMANYNYGLVILYNLTGGCGAFGDVDGASPFCPNVEWLYNRAITLGCAPTARYCPGAGVTRLAMAAFLDRLGLVMSGHAVAAQQSPLTVFPGFVTVLCQTAAFAATGHPRRAQIDIVFAATSSAAVDILITPVSGAFFFWNAIGTPSRITVPASRLRNTRLHYSWDVPPEHASGFGIRVEHAAGSGPALSDANCNVRARIENRND